MPTDVIATVTLNKSLAVVIKLDLNSQDSVWIYIKHNKTIKHFCKKNIQNVCMYVNYLLGSNI